MDQHERLMFWGKGWVRGEHPLRLNKQRIGWVHFFCAHFSPQAFHTDMEGRDRAWYGLKDGMIRGGHFKCEKCGKRGANFGCTGRTNKKSCPDTYHMACAASMTETTEYSVDCYTTTNFPFVCPKHSVYDGNRREALVDLLSGREQCAVTVRVQVRCSTDAEEGEGCGDDRSRW